MLLLKRIRTKAETNRCNRFNASKMTESFINGRQCYTHYNLTVLSNSHAFYVIKSEERRYPDMERNGILLLFNWCVTSFPLWKSYVVTKLAANLTMIKLIHWLRAMFARVFASIWFLKQLPSFNWYANITLKWTPHYRHRIYIKASRSFSESKWSASSWKPDNVIQTNIEFRLFWPRKMLHCWRSTFILTHIFCSNTVLNCEQYVFHCL